MIVGRYLLPHPPIIIPEVGRGEELKSIKTVEAYKTVGKEVKELDFDTVVIVTPHGKSSDNEMTILADERVSGDLSLFGVPEISMEFSNDQELAAEIDSAAGQQEIPVVLLKSQGSKVAHRLLDHGSLVPLYYFPQKNFQILVVTYAPLSPLKLYKFGQIIKEAADKLGRKILYIASGDLSHYLSEDGPYGYRREGEIFDQRFLKLVEKGDTSGLVFMDPDLCMWAGECGLPSVHTLLGTLEGKKWHGKVLSYEAPFGVGYGLVVFIEEEDEGVTYSDLNFTDNKDEEEDPYVNLAKESIRYFLENGEIMPLSKKLPEEFLSESTGSFVSLKKGGRLRGCIGTIYPTKEYLGEEIIANAVSAAVADPRFEPVSLEEFEDLDVSVDVLTTPEPAEKKDLDPVKYGVIVEKGYRKGVLLPDLEGVDTVEEQLNIACQKAGIDYDEEFKIYRFKVVRHR